MLGSKNLLTMNQYLKNLTSVLEVLIMKSVAQDKPLNGLTDPESLPIYDIYDHDITDCGMTIASFASTLRILEKQGYIDLEGLMPKEAEEKEIVREGSTINKVLHQASYTVKAGIRFNVFVKGNIWRLYEVILKEEDLDKINLGTTIYFADEYSLLVNGMRLPIKLKADAPNEHYILSHMMKNGFEKMYDYSEMIKMKVLDDKEWRAYFDACNNLNAKVAKLTDNKITKLLEHKSGETGYVRLNPRYL